MRSKTTNRGIILIAAAIAGLMDGASLMWSIFRNPLMELNGWSPSQVTLAYSLFWTSCLAGCFIAGPLQRKMKPSLLVLMAGCLQGLGFFLTGYAKTIPQLYLFYSLIAGMGNGLIYNAAISTATKWFPDKTGFANGICVGAMGLAPLLFSPLGNWLIEHFDVCTSFKINGIIMIVTFLLFSWFIKAPEEGWRPEGWTGSTKVCSKLSGNAVGKDYVWTEMLKTPAFYLIWVMTICSVTSGVMMTGQASAIAQEVSNVTAGQAALQIGLMAVASFSGRFIFGSLSDKIGRFNTQFILLSVTSVMMLVFLGKAHSFVSFMICMMVIGMCYGGVMSILPGHSRDNFGLKNFSVNHNFVYSAYAVASYIGPLVASATFERTGSYNNAFTIAGIIAVGGILFALFAKKACSSIASESEVV